MKKIIFIILLADIFGSGFLSYGPLTAAEEIAIPYRRRKEKQITAEIVGLPNVLYLGEKLNFSLRIINKSSHAGMIVVAYVYGEESVSQQIKLSANAETLAVLPLQLQTINQECRASLSIRHSEEKKPFWQESFFFIDGRGSLENVFVQTDRYVNTNGQTVVLVNRYEVESQYRRWAAIRWIKQSWRRRKARRILWAPKDHPAGSINTSRIKPAMVSYSGNFLQSALNVDKIVPNKGAVILAIAWGSEEASCHLPPRSMIRALDLAIDRACDLNPACQILLLTPPPILGAEKATNRYADALRNLGREHHAPVLDLHSLILKQENWRRLYAMDNDPAITCFWPNAEGQEIMAKAITEAM